MSCSRSASNITLNINDITMPSNAPYRINDGYNNELCKLSQNQNSNGGGNSHNLKYLQEIETLRKVLADFNQKKRDEWPIYQHCGSLQRDTSATLPNVGSGNLGISFSKLNPNSS